MSAAVKSRSCLQTPSDALSRVGEAHEVHVLSDDPQRMIIRAHADQVEDDDEVLLVMAEQLGEMVPLVGGYTEAGCLMELLGRLCTVEETVVRDKASSPCLCTEAHP